MNKQFKTELFCNELYAIMLGENNFVHNVSTE
jgi:hypothetical protein